MGKTAFVLNIAQNVAFKENKTTAIFSLEMSKEQLVNRLFSLESQVDSQSLRTGNLKDSDWEKLIESAGIIGKSNLKMCIRDSPWIWDSETGDEVDAKDEKLYHWNTKGGSSEWELPDSWSGLKDVKVYKLTDLGKTDEKTVKVVDGKITLEADAETPYVVCKGDEANLEITWRCV